MNSHCWTLLRTSPQSQQKYLSYVAEFFPQIQMYFPVYTRITRPHRCRHPIEVQLPVYPGYIFSQIDLNGDDIYNLRRSPIKAHFVRFGGKISQIPEYVILELRRMEAESLLVRDPVKVNPYLPGRRVSVHTPIADIKGIIIRLMGRNKVVIDTSLGETTVGLHSVTLL